MGIFQALFVALNLTVPIWIWTRGSGADAPNVDWRMWQTAIRHVVDNKGGFPPCSNKEVVAALLELCQSSQRNWREKETVRMERAAIDVVLSCEVRRDGVFVGMSPLYTTPPSLQCAGQKSGKPITQSPGFVFTLAGKLRALEFDDERRARQTISIARCRAKAKKAFEMPKIPEQLDEFLVRLGRFDGEPEDHMSTNRICYLFDLSSQWRPWRAKYNPQLVTLPIRQNDGRKSP